MKKNNVINRSFNGIFAAVATTIVLLMAGSVNASAQDEPMRNPEIAPEYPGGVVALVSFLQQNLKYCMPNQMQYQNAQSGIHLLKAQLYMLH